MISKALLSSISFFALFGTLSACSNPQPGPDKTIAGAVLGAGWGAGAGAVIGNQVSYAGEGAGIGAGFGAVAGAMSGAGYDLNEGVLLDQEEVLASLKLQSAANERQLKTVQSQLDGAMGANSVGAFYQVFFDNDQTNLRPGSIANLEVITDQLKASPSAGIIHVSGHSDDSGNPEYNDRLAEARARAVSAYIAQRGVSLDQIKVESFGAKRPIASNASPVGRQLNRRVDIFIGPKAP